MCHVSKRQIMDNNSNFELNNNQEFVTFLRTILMILENHKFSETITIFKAECEKFGFKLNNSINENKFPKIIFENFSKSEPCRIIIENYDENQTKNIPNLENDVNNSSNQIDIINETNITNNELVENIQNNKKELNSLSKTSTPDTKKSDYDSLKRKFSTLQTEHQKLMDVVTELTFALQTSIKGQIEDTHIILNNCEKIYPELFYNKTKIKNINEEENFQNNEIKANHQFVNNDLKPRVEAINNFKLFFNLDYQKIKSDLKNGDINTKNLLLQALRWRITKTSPILRDYIIKSYIQNDILNVHCCHQTSSAYPKNSIVFACFYCSCNSPQSLQQSVTRFVNALASVKPGRDYIIHQSVILNILMSVLLGSHPDNIDGITRNMIIATLQKISIRYNPRMVMIADGLTEYLTKFLLINYLSLNDYCLEYSMALLKNLWLHSEAREKCRPMATDIIKLLANLLDEQYFICFSYITGALYNLLPDNFFHKAAVSINLEQIILYRIEKLNGEMKDQLQYILEVYLNPNHWQCLCECDLGTDSENETDVIEPDIDQNEMINYSDSNGEQFLFEYRRTYSIEGTEMNLNYITNIFSTPVTPNINIISRASQLNNKSIPEIEYLEYAAQFLNEQMNKKIQSAKNEEKKDQKVAKELELTFCEDTQQLYVVPSKKGIFVEDTLHKFNPSFLKNIGDSNVNNVSKSLPVTPRDKNINSKPSTATTKVVEQYLTPTANFSGICYREGLKPRSFSESSAPHIGFCNKEEKNERYSFGKYSCSCFAELKRSFDEDTKKKNKNEISDNIFTSNYCKYKIYPTSNSAPLQTSPKKERESTGSKSLDETDYSSVFESRPKLLRTP